MTHKSRWILVLIGIALMVLPGVALAQEALTETYADEAVTFQYPSGWLIGKATAETILLGNSQRAAEDTGSVRSGEVRISFLKNVGQVADNTPFEYLETFMARSGTGREFDEVVEATFGERAVAAVPVKEESANLERLIAIVDLGDGKLGGMIATNAFGELSTNIETLVAILETYQSVEDTQPGLRPFNPNRLPEGFVKFTNTAGTFSLNHPEGWQVIELEDGLIGLYNKPEVLTGDLATLPRGGVLIFVHPTLELIPGYPRNGERDPQAIIEFWVAGRQRGFTTAGDIDTFTTDDGRKGAKGSAIHPDYDVFIISQELENGNIATLFAYTPSGEMDRFSAEYDLIAEGFAVGEITQEPDTANEPPADFARFNAEGGFAVFYPEDWVIQEFDVDPVILVRTSRNVGSDLNELRAGELNIFIFKSVTDLAKMMDYPYDAGGNTVPSTIVSYFASMGFVTGYEQQGAMGAFSVETRTASTSYAKAAQHDRLVMAIEDGQGGIITMFVFGPPDGITAYQDTLEQMLGLMGPR